MDEILRAKANIAEKIATAGIFVKQIDFVDEHNYIEKSRAILEVVGNLRLVGEF